MIQNVMQFPATADLLSFLLVLSVS